MNAAVQEYITARKQDIAKTLVDKEIVTKFSYGKNKEKNGYYVQTFGVKANDTIKGSSHDTSENNTNSDENIKSTENENQVNNNSDDIDDSNNSDKAVGGVTYNI